MSLASAGPPVLSLRLLWSLVCLIPSVITPLVSHAAANPIQVIESIGYPGAVKGERRRSLDLYLPAAAAKPPPLVIFIHGGFWLLTDDDYRIGPQVADALTRAGIAVALLRYRLAPAAHHPAQAEDVAAGVALLLGAADRYGYDKKRVFLAGHSAGGHLAALVGLDESFLAKQGASAKSLAGIISLSGLYDLLPRWSVGENQKAATAQTFGVDPNLLRRASPVSHARADAPPFLLLIAQNDFPGFLIDAEGFHQALRKAGHRHVERWIVPARDHFSLLRLDERDNPARPLLLDFLKVEAMPRRSKRLLNDRPRQSGG